MQEIDIIQGFIQRGGPLGFPPRILNLVFFDTQQFISS